MHIRYVSFLLLLAVVPCEAVAQSVSVSPSCGTNTSHVYLSTSGWSFPAPCDSCSWDYTVYVDGQSVYGIGGGAGNCVPEFTIDLHDLPNGQCANCTLGPGEHTLKVLGFVECSPNYYNQTCVQTNFTVVSSSGNGDPWEYGLSSSSDSQYVYVNFNPCGICDVPACDSILFIAVIQPLKEPVDQRYTYAEQGFPNAAARDSQLTQTGFAVDVPPKVDDPYCLPRFRGVPLYDIGFKDGSCGAAVCADNPSRGPSSYQTGVEKIVLNFEVNAICAAGRGEGQWLGACTFSWERPLDGPDRFTFGNCSRALPSSNFKAALDLWRSIHRSFEMPSRPHSTSGGVKVSCN